MNKTTAEINLHSTVVLLKPGRRDLGRIWN